MDNSNTLAALRALAATILMTLCLFAADLYELYSKLYFSASYKGKPFATYVFSRADPVTKSKDLDAYVFEKASNNFKAHKGKTIDDDYVRYLSVAQFNLYKRYSLALVAQLIVLGFIISFRERIATRDEQPPLSKNITSSSTTKKVRAMAPQASSQLISSIFPSARPVASQPSRTFHNDTLRAAAPLTAVVFAIWLSLPLIGEWGLMKKGLDAFAPESSGAFFWSGLIVLLYRRKLHPLVTAGALLIFIPPAALLFYLPLKTNGLGLLLIPFGIACVELARYAGSRLPSPSMKFMPFRWQLPLFIVSFMAALLLAGFITYL